jgi:ribosomal protein L24
MLDDEVKLRKGEEVVVIDGSLHGVEGYMWSV